MKPILKQALVTGVTAVSCLYITQWCKLPQGYWAVMSAIIVMQADAAATVTASWTRVIGTLVGALVGGSFLALFGYHVWAFGIAIGLVVLLCTLLKVADSYRLAAVTVAVIMLTYHSGSPWATAAYRFLEVSFGILIALAIAALMYPSYIYQHLRTGFMNWYNHPHKKGPAMKLLYTKRSPYARKVRVVALEKGIALEFIDEDLQNKSRQLLDANPLGKVPTLILDNGTTVYDSPVICQYLDGLNDRMVMIPPESAQRIEVLKWEAFADDLMTAAINLYMEKVRHPADFHKDFTAALEKNIRAAYEYIEKNLGRLKEFNLAPVAVASAIGYIHFRLPHLQVQGALAAWYQEISKRPSMAQTIPVA